MLVGPLLHNTATAAATRKWFSETKCPHKHIYIYIYIFQCFSVSVPQTSCFQTWILENVWKIGSFPFAYEEHSGRMSRVTIAGKFPKHSGTWVKPPLACHESSGAFPAVFPHGHYKHFPDISLGGWQEKCQKMSGAQFEDILRSHIQPLQKSLNHVWKQQHLYSILS